MNKNKKASNNMLRKNVTPMLVLFLAPAVILYLTVYLYPVLRTVTMSLFSVESISDPVSAWAFNGIENYISIFNDSLFITSMTNFLKIWIIGGIGVLLVALLFAVILTSGVRGKKFYRSVIYLPNLIAAVAMGNMWLYYVLNKEDFGLFNSIIGFFGGENVLWTGPDMLFWSMLIAYSFGMVGYNMLIFMSGIERIGVDFYEAARIEGANRFQQFFSITLPLLKGSIRTNIVMWTVSSVGFFIWAQVFSPISLSTETVMPLNYVFELLFGSGVSTATRNPGAAAAIGVVMAIVVVSIFMLTNLIVKNDDVEL